MSQEVSGAGSFHRLGQALEEIVPSMRCFSSDPAAFRGRFARRRVGDVDLIALSGSAFRGEVAQSEGYHLVLPLVGNARMTAGLAQVDIIGGKNAVIMPNIARSTERQTSSAIIATIDPARLSDSIYNMSMDEDKPISFGEEIIKIDFSNRPEYISWRCQSEAQHSGSVA